MQGSDTTLPPPRLTLPFAFVSLTVFDTCRFPAGWPAQIARRRLNSGYGTRSYADYGRRHRPGAGRSGPPLHRCHGREDQLGRARGRRRRHGPHRHAAARRHDGERPPHALRAQGPDHHARSGTGFRSINVHLRQALGLYACIRPCKQYKGVRTFFSAVPIDLVIVRENTEDLYAGIEFEKGKDDTARADRVHQQHLARPQDQDRRPTKPASRSSRSASRAASGSSAARSTMPARTAARR